MLIVQTQQYQLKNITFTTYAISGNGIISNAGEAITEDLGHVKTILLLPPYFWVLFDGGPYPALARFNIPSQHPI